VRKQLPQGVQLLVRCIRGNSSLYRLVKVED
jgi:hypothetical protein